MKGDLSERGGDVGQGEVGVKDVGVGGVCVFLVSLCVLKSKGGHLYPGKLQTSEKDPM